MVKNCLTPEICQGKFGRVKRGYIPSQSFADFLYVLRAGILTMAIVHCATMATLAGRVIVV